MKEKILSGEGKGTEVEIRPMSFDEVCALRGTHELVHTAYYGSRHNEKGLVHVLVNGKPKTWKTRPGDVRVPVKYGLYEYAYIEIHNGSIDHTLYFVKVVE
jgi:predicted AAA+ superfamily ATPase